jgi:hypothetical protein
VERREEKRIEEKWRGEKWRGKKRREEEMRGEGRRGEERRGERLCKEKCDRTQQRTGLTTIPQQSNDSSVQHSSAVALRCQKNSKEYGGLLFVVVQRCRRRSDRAVFEVLHYG